MTRADRGGKDLAFAETIGFCQYHPTFMDWDGTTPTLTALEICPCARGSSTSNSPQNRTPSIFKNFPHQNAALSAEAAFKDGRKLKSITFIINERPIRIAIVRACQNVVI